MYQVLFNNATHQVKAIAIGINELLSQRGRLEDRPARKQIPTVKSLTREHSPMQMEQSTGTFNILDVARKVISELMHKHQLII